MLGALYSPSPDSPWHNYIYRLGFIIPGTQMRKTEVCIYEATYSRQSDANRLLGWFQNKVESPLQHQVPPTLNSAD